MKASTNEELKEFHFVGEEELKPSHERFSFHGGGKIMDVWLHTFQE